MSLIRALPWCTLLAVCVTGLCKVVLYGSVPDAASTVPVSGTVLLAGHLLEGGEVEFHSPSARATGRIEPDGSYRLTTFQPGDGAVPGVYRVAVRPLHSQSGTPLVSIPARYADPETSGLSYEIVQSTNVIDIALEADTGAK
jgi:hypothetical protein